VKRNLIAAAVLGTMAGAASSQTTMNNVTFFGLVDVNISHFSSGDNSNPISASNPTGAGRVPSRTAMMDGTQNGLNGSRWGVRTAEPITGDLTVGAWLESGFDLSQGSSFQQGRLFGRQAFVYVNSKTWGDLRLGRQYVFADNIIPQGNPFANALLFNPTTSVTNNGRNVATMLDSPRADNVIQYKTPEIAGFWAGVQYAPHENTAPNTFGAFDSFYGFAAAYNKAPLFLGVSYEYNHQRSSDDDVNKSLSFAAKWDFGFARLMGNYQKADDLAVTANGHTGTQLTQLVVGQGNRTITTTDQDSYSVGAELPWQAFTFGVSYVRVKYEGTPSAAGLPSSYTFGKSVAGVKYDMSKRTFLYFDFSIANGDLKDYIVEDKVVQAGIQHRF
jgi:GBP family porin